MKTYSFAGRGRAAAEAALRAIEQRGKAPDLRVERKVRAIIAAVRRDGDAAVSRFAGKFDGLPRGTSIRVSTAEMAEGWELISPTERAALKLAAQRIRAFAKRQLPREWSLRDSAGMHLGQIVRPLDAVACYVPAGRHPLPSTLLMTAIPAQVAGVRRIVVLCPKPSAMVLAAAHLLGIEDMRRIGGAHAIAAAASGTETLPAVNKICGPGSAFVTAAKKIIARDAACRCSIDMAAGPTETCIASLGGNAAAIAADLVAQAEHDPLALALFVTTSEALARQVTGEIAKQASANRVARQALRARGTAFVVRSEREMAEVVNRIACEHLTIDTENDLSWVRNAGSVFIGATPQALGDYISGPNHTLPTDGFAKLRGGLSVADFVKIITVQQASKEAVRKLAPQAALLADAEGLVAHAASLRGAEAR